MPEQFRSMSIGFVNWVVPPFPDDYEEFMVMVVSGATSVVWRCGEAGGRGGAGKYPLLY